MYETVGGPENQTGFTIYRPHYVYDFPSSEELSYVPDWFAQNQEEILFFLRGGMLDLRMLRSVSANMLLEAWNSEKFIRENGQDGATELDRVLQIAWLQHLTSTFGILSHQDIITIQHLGGRLGLTRPPQYLFESDPSVTTTFEACLGNKKKGRVRGFFHGSFHPPTSVHVMLAAFYSQFCHELIIGCDNNALMLARKADQIAETGKFYPYDLRAEIWRHFPHAVSAVVPVRMLTVDPAQMVRDYRELEVDIVFFNSNDSAFDERLRNTLAAGARPFYHDPDFRFHASDQIRSAIRGELYGSAEI